MARRYAFAPATPLTTTRQWPISSASSVGARRPLVVVATPAAAWSGAKARCAFCCKQRWCARSATQRRARVCARATADGGGGGGGDNDKDERDGIAQRRVAANAAADASPPTGATAPRVVPGGSVTSPRGFVATGYTAGFKPSGGADLAVIASELPAAAAGVFTTSCVAAAPVAFCREQLRRSGSVARAIVVNSGQANAATGEQGACDTRDTAEITSAMLQLPLEHVLVASTGVIGRRIDMDKMRDALPRMFDQLSWAAPAEQSGAAAARAIMTTDLVPKQYALEADIDGGTVTVGVICKGSGMIHPDMATMLAFVTTDARVEPPSFWQRVVAEAAAETFNQITVDGDTSTNDTLIALANGASGVCITEDDRIEDADDDGSGVEARAAFQRMLTSVLHQAAKCIARDGEGATVLLEVRVDGADTDTAARSAARTVAGSALVKSAVYGRDPNWGRIAAAVGRAPGVRFAQHKLHIWIGEHQMMRGGQPMEHDARAAREYMQRAAAAAVTNRQRVSGGMAAAAATEHEGGGDNEDEEAEAGTVRIRVRLGEGGGTGVAYGCDLTHDYVTINAEYTT